MGGTQPGLGMDNDVLASDDKKFPQAVSLYYKVYGYTLEQPKVYLYPQGEVITLGQSETVLERKGKEGN